MKYRLLLLFTQIATFTCPFIAGNHGRSWAVFFVTIYQIISLFRLRYSGSFLQLFIARWTSYVFKPMAYYHYKNAGVLA